MGFKISLIHPVGSSLNHIIQLKDNNRVRLRMLLLFLHNFNGRASLIFLVH
jgi:hypothetical protein